MKKIFSVLMIAIILISCIPLQSIHAAQISTESYDPSLINFVKLDNIGTQSTLGSHNFYFVGDINCSITVTVDKGETSEAVYTSSGWSRSTLSGYGDGITYTKYIMPAINFNYSYQIEVTTPVWKAWGGTNVTDSYNFIIYQTSQQNLPDDSSLNKIYYDSAKLEIVTDNYTDLLSSLSPSPGFNEFIIYEMQGGSKVAEYYKQFPLVTFVSDSVRDDDFAKWKWTGSGDREVYFCTDDETWDLASKTSTSYTGYFTGLEIKIISSSVPFNDDLNNSYGGSLGGDSSTDPVDIDPDSPTTVRITSPLDGLETTKTSAYFEILVNTPTTVKAGILNMATYTASMPLIYFETNNITNPDNNLGYLPWTQKITYFTENNTFWENNDEYEDFELKSVTSNILGNNRTEYVFRVICNLETGNNDFTISIKPIWHSLSSTGAFAYPQYGDIVVRDLTVIRSTSVDANNDGVDDNTNETLDDKPYDGSVINDSDNTQWVNDGSPVTDSNVDAAALTSVFKNILSVITMFTTQMGGVMNFLPPEIITIIVLSMSVGVFLFIFKAILGR